jgi:GNAT superfamily N-acetyltransferase
MFEALPSSREASRLLIDKACEWFRDQGLVAVRAGFGPFEPGFIIDDYATFLPRMTRHNPPYYHSVLKYAGFDTEKGAGEYIIKVSEELVARYRGYLQSAQRTGYDIIPLHEMRASQWVANFTSTWNDAYRSHWGLAPLTESEFATLFNQPGDTTTLELSAIAYRDGHAVGVGLVRKDRSVRGTGKWRFRIRQQSELEQLNSFAVGVCPSDRGRGVGLALASHAYLQLISRGAKYLSFGLVVDDNWPSRRVAEKLGSYTCVNYLTYRKTLSGSPRIRGA